MAHFCFSPPAYCPGNLVFYKSRFFVSRSMCLGIRSMQSLHVRRSRGRMLLNCKEFRSDVKSILKFNRSNDVLNSKWRSSKFAFFHRAMLCGHSHHWLLVTSPGASALSNSHSRAVGRPSVSFLKRRGASPGACFSCTLCFFLCIWGLQTTL